MTLGELRMQVFHLLHLRKVWKVLPAPMVLSTNPPPVFHICRVNAKPSPVPYLLVIDESTWVNFPKIISI
jgi:hypothetical protein